MNNTVTVILNTQEAEQFKSFQRNYQLFNTLLEKGAFEVQFGKVILNIAFGEVQNIVKEEVVYKR